MAANEEVPYTLPSLLELSYHACNSNDRKQYDELPITPVDLKVCCDSILKIIKFNSDGDRFRPYGDLQFMFDKVRPDYRLINNICEVAAFHGHINCMKFARAIGVPWCSPDLWQKSACDEAAESGNIECLVFAHLNGSPWSSWTCNFAAGNGHLDCLMYLHDNGCPWNDFTCSNAAKNGHLECLIYAQQNGCPWDADTCSLAAWSGHLECLKYCRENDCPWDTFTCEMAACTGELECLKYARANGCPWTEKTCIVAAYYGQIDCLRYAYENGCEWDIDGYLSTFHGVKDSSCVRYALEIKYSSRHANKNGTGLTDDILPSK